MVRLLKRGELVRKGSRGRWGSGGLILAFSKQFCFRMLCVFLLLFYLANLIFFIISPVKIRKKYTFTLNNIQESKLLFYLVVLHVGKNILKVYQNRITSKGPKEYGRQGNRMLKGDSQCPSCFLKYSFSPFRVYHICVCS